MQSFIHRARVAADPMTNGRKYGPAAGQLLNKALQLDPQNPRALYLDGLTKFQTPAMWGGDKKKARAQFEAAAQQFDQPAASAVAPHEGKMPAKNAGREVTPAPARRKAPSLEMKKQCSMNENWQVGNPRKRFQGLSGN